MSKIIVAVMALTFVLFNPLSVKGDSGKGESAKGAPATGDSLPFVAGHKSVCMSYDDVSWDPKHGGALQVLVDSGYFPPGVDYAVAQLAYSLSTPKSIDPINGSARLLLNQVWYPVLPADATEARTTTHLDLFTNSPAGLPLATNMSQVLNIGGLAAAEAGDYPNAPIGYGGLLRSDPAVEIFVFDGPAGSVENAPIAAASGPFPVIVLDSPGHEQSQYAEELAARGYVVIAPSHPGDQFYDGILNKGLPIDGTPIGGIPYGLNCTDAQIDAAKPVNGVLDFDTNILNTWLVDGGVYLGTLQSPPDIQKTLRLRAIDIGMVISRAHTLFTESNVVDQERVGLLGFSLGGNAVQLSVSDDAVLANASLVPQQARAGLDAVDATVVLAGNNRFISSSSTATAITKPSLAIQGRQDLVVNRGVDATYGGATLQEPNTVFADNYQHRYSPRVPAMRVLVDRFGHSDFQSGEPLIACLEHGGSASAVPANCIAARPTDERYALVPGASGGLEVGGSYKARSLEERLDITMLYTNAWFDLYVKQEVCSANRELSIDGKVIASDMNKLKRLQKNHFDPASVDRRHRNLQQGNADKNASGKRCP